jgi:hypothetical protein
LSGSLKLEGVSVDRPALRAKIDAALDVSGVGGSASALVGGLAGSGSLTVAEVKVPRLDPDALARAMAKIEQAAGATLEQNKLAAAIGAELDRGPLTIDKASSTLASSSGVVRFGPFDAPARDGGATIAGALGLSDMSLSVQETLIDEKTGPFWKGPPPTVETEAKGSLDALARKVDVSLLSAGLASEAIARESDRIANYEADLRERAYFNRRFKAERFLARRDAEIAAFLEERERRALMDQYLPPYAAWAASHKENPTPPAPSARLEGGHAKAGAKDPAGSGLY